MFNFFKNNNNLTQEIDSLRAQVEELKTLISDGSDALAEVRELRERVYPLFAQGADANAALIEKVARVRIKYPKKQ